LHKPWLLWFCLFIIEAGLVSLGYFLAFLVRFGRAIPSANLVPLIALIPYISFCVLICFWFFEIYSHTWKRRLGTLYNVFITVLFINVSVVAITFLLRGFVFPRLIFLIAGVIQFCLLGAWRLLWQSVFGLKCSEIRP